jgi:hypothetical protein
MTKFATNTATTNTPSDHTHDSTPDHSPDLTPDLTLIRNDYRWTPACQRVFLEELACTGSVTQACAYVAKSPRSAYDLRFRRDGAALALGWDGAILMARIVVADQLMDRALSGYEEVSVKQDDGSRVRHKQDNRLGQNLLARLDRMADAQAVAGSRQAQVQLVLQDFEAYLDLIERGGTGAAAALFCVARGSDHAPIDETQEYEIECELERISAAEAEAEDAARAQRAQVMLDMEPEVAAQLLEVWYDEYAKCWKTNFPAPGAAGDLKDMLDTWDDGDTEQSAFFGDEDYERTLTQQELSAHFAALASVRQPWIDAAIVARDAWFGGKVAAGDGVAKAA